MLPQKTFAEAKSLEVGVGRGRWNYREGGKEFGKKPVWSASCVDWTGSVSNSAWGLRVVQLLLMLRKRINIFLFHR